MPGSKRVGNGRVDNEDDGLDPVEAYGENNLLNYNFNNNEA